MNHKYHTYTDKTGVNRIPCHRRRYHMVHAYTYEGRQRQHYIGHPYETSRWEQTFHLTSLPGLHYYLYENKVPSTIKCAVLKCHSMLSCLVIKCICSKVSRSNVPSSGGKLVLTNLVVFEPGFKLAFKTCKRRAIPDGRGQIVPGKTALDGPGVLCKRCFPKLDFTVPSSCCPRAQQITFPTDKLP